MKHWKTLLALLAVLTLAWSCTDWSDGWTKPPKDVKGYKPVYISRTEAYIVGAQAPQNLAKPGKIYIYGGKLLIVEKLKGIHIFDNSDPANPVNLAFISVPGVNDVSVSSGVLYADNVDDLVAFDIKDMANITLVKRIKGQFPNGILMYPEQANGQYFECVDTTKGIVVDWEYTTLNNPKCYR
jgi:hypothetical protein